MKTVIYSTFILIIMIISSCNGKKDNAMSSAQPHAKITKTEVTQASKKLFQTKIQGTYYK